MPGRGTAGAKILDIRIQNTFSALKHDLAQQSGLRERRKRAVLVDVEVTRAGTEVTITSQSFRKRLSTDDDGRVLFLNFKPGTYALKAELQGFLRRVRGCKYGPGGLPG